MADFAPSLARYTDPEVAAQLGPLLGQATAHLLGSTIAITEEEWRAPSALPGWSRGHLATHVARNADGLARLVTGVLTGQPGEMYPSSEARDADIEAGSGRDGEDLQTDLDTSAAALDELFDRVPAEAAWSRSVSLRTLTAPVGALLGARLAEVVLHHIDLGSGEQLEQQDESTLAAVLDWVAVRVGSQLDQPVRLVAADRHWALGGSTGETIEVSGTVAEHLAWLSGRGPAPEGAVDIIVPSF